MKYTRRFYMHPKKTKREKRKRKIGGTLLPKQKQVTKKHPRDHRKQTHCSPFAKANAVTPDSCLTPNTLMQIKNAYNASHSDTITGDDPVKIRNQIRAKMQQNCVGLANEELCWLDNLAKPKVSNRRLPSNQESNKGKTVGRGGLTTANKNQIIDELFVPERPHEWNRDPNTWLSNFDIAKVMDQYEVAYPKFRFIGPVSIDFAKPQSHTKKAPNNNNQFDPKCVNPDLCTLTIRKLLDQNKTDVGVVLNLDTHDGPGTHWVSMFMRLSVPEPYLFYFNSTGEKEPHEIIEFRDKIQADHLSTVGTPLKYYSSKAEHQRSNTECGMYSLVFLVSMVSRQQFETGDPMTDAQLIQMYTDDRSRIADSTIEQFRHIYFR